MNKLVDLPYGKHDIDEDDVQSVTRALKSSHLTSGQEVSLFEKELAQYLTANYAVACANGTAALHLASLVLGLGKGDWVIVPAVTFLATANAVRYVGADVYFADVDAESGLVNVETIKKAFEEATKSGKNVKAIYTVHLNGQVADPEAIYKFAKQHDLFVVEDSCHAIGTCFQYNNKTENVGSCRTCDMSTFSFHPVKTITMGEGGAVSCNDETLYKNLIKYRNHSMTRDSHEFQIKSQALSSNEEINPWYYEMHEIGFNYRASDINCALGRSQLRKLHQISRKRKQLACIYDELIQDMPESIKPVKKIANCDPVLHLYAVLISFDCLKQTKAYYMNELKRRGVSTQVHYLPVNKQPYYIERYGLFELAGANSYYEMALSLPYFQSMDVQDIRYVTDQLKLVLIQ